VFNAANEELVAAFFEGRLPFLGIVDTLTVVVDEHLDGGNGNPRDVDDVLAAENRARARARELTGRAA
jgi:1-deoxy-D-xylulose-5-phosphate reductoisomerase